MSNPIIPWIGGKRRLAKHLLPLFPEHECYVELFCGAAALFFMKEPAKTEVINDINWELSNLYRVVTHHAEEFYRQFKYALVSRKVYEWETLKTPETLTDIQRAARFFYIQKLSFGGKIEGRTFGTAPSSPPRLNILRLEEDISAAHLRLSRTYIETLDWARCLKKWDRDYTFFYVDPPYWQTEGYGVAFGIEQYEALAKAATTIKGKMLISVNDHPEMRRVFDGLDIRTVDVSYTVGGANKRKKATELIIKSW